MTTSSNQFDHGSQNNRSAEMALLGFLASSNGDKKIFARLLLVVNRDVFFHSDCRIVFDAIEALLQLGEEVNTFKIRDYLGRTGKLDNAAVDQFFAKMMAEVPRWTNVEACAEVVANQGTSRDAIQSAFDVTDNATAPVKQEDGRSMHVEGVAERTSSATKDQTSAAHSIGDITKSIVNRLVDKDCQISTGFPSIDRVTGLPRGGATIVAALSREGKTAFIQQVVLNAAFRGISVGVISIGQNRTAWGENVLANLSGISRHRIGNSPLNGRERQSVVDAAASTRHLPLHIVHSQLERSAVEDAARRLALDYGCKLIAVDDMHEVVGGTDKPGTSESSIIRGTLKEVWDRHNVAGVEVAQVRSTGRPTIAKFRHSGTLRLCADLILLLHRVDYLRCADSTLEDPAGNLDQRLEVHVGRREPLLSHPVVVLNYDSSNFRITDGASFTYSEDSDFE